MAPLSETPPWSAPSATVSGFSPDFVTPFVEACGAAGVPAGAAGSRLSRRVVSDPGAGLDRGVAARCGVPCGSRCASRPDFRCASGAARGASLPACAVSPADEGGVPRRLPDFRGASRAARLASRRAVSAGSDRSGSDRRGDRDGAGTSRSPVSVSFARRAASRALGVTRASLTSSDFSPDRDARRISRSVTTLRLLIESDRDDGAGRSEEYGCRAAMERLRSER